MAVNYLTNFTVYATAMVGVFMIAVFIFKKTIQPSAKTKNKNLAIEESMTLACGKNLYVIKVGNEKFLIASDRERTALISKLNEQPIRQNRHMELQDFSTNCIPDTLPKKPVMKELINKLNV